MTLVIDRELLVAEIKTFLRLAFIDSPATAVTVDEDGTICVVQPDGPAFGVVVVGLRVPA